MSNWLGVQVEGPSFKSHMFREPYYMVEPSRASTEGPGFWQRPISAKYLNCLGLNGLHFCVLQVASVRFAGTGILGNMILHVHLVFFVRPGVAAW